MDSKKWVSDEEILRVCQTSQSMLEASAKLKINFKTLRRRSKMLGCYKPNQSGKGIHKDYPSRKIPLSEILEGKHPQYSTYHLKQRLLQTGIKKNICDKCKIDEWNKEPLNCELDHIDGNKYNHLIDNLRMLCPNCHSQTPTYRSKIRVPIEKFIE